MADVVFIVITLTFFAVCVLYVRGLDRMIRASETSDEGDEGMTP